MPFSSARTARYGGNTSCIEIVYKDSVLIVDAGSGLSELQMQRQAKDKNFAKSNIDLLLSHLHMDHIMGLGTFMPVHSKGSNMKIYTCSRGEVPLHEQIFGVFKPPYWPIHISETTDVVCNEILSNKTFCIGDFEITPFMAYHPDITLSFHIAAGGISLVHLLDSELGQMDERGYKELVDFCHNADMVIFDAAYSREDYAKRVGWGHSTVEDGIKLAEKSGCKSMVFSHFSLEYSDNDLDSWKKKLDPQKYMMAYDGMEIKIGND